MKNNNDQNPKINVQSDVSLEDSRKRIDAKRQNGVASRYSTNFNFSHELSPAYCRIRSMVLLLFNLSRFAELREYKNFTIEAD